MGHTPITADWLDRVPEDLDLRKRHAEGVTGRLVQRAHWLDSKDRDLVLAMFRDGQSANAIAHGLNQDPRQIRRRIKRLVNRLNDPRVAYVIAHHEKWSKSRRVIARSLFIEGRSMREATDDLGLSFYSVRKHREAIEAMCLAAMSSSQMRTWRT